MTKWLLAALIALSLIPMGEANAGRRDDRCRYQSLERAKWTDHEVRGLIRCSVEHWSVPGGKAKALDVARCESGFEARTSGVHLGVFQFASQTWDSNTRRFRERRRRWNVSDNALNARANVLVAIWMAHAGGWGPWACG